MIEENSPNRMSCGLKPGDEELIFTAILLCHILHDGGNAIHVEVKVTSALNSVPHLFRIVISRHASIPGAAICYYQRRDENKRQVLAGTRKIGRSRREISIGTFDHDHDRPFLPAG